MDNSRWIVVLSVVFSMMLVLTLLSRYARKQTPEVAVTVEQVRQPSSSRTEVRRPQVAPSRKGVVPVYSHISFPKPAAHTLVVEQPAELDRIKQSQRVEGTIIR